MRRSASIEEHPRGSGRYRVRARVGGRMVTIASGLTERVATETADAYAALRAEGELRAGITLGGFGPGYLDRRESRGLRSVREDRNRWATTVEADELAGIALAELRRVDVLGWRDRLLARKLAPQTVRNALNLVRGALGEALDRELVTANVATGIRVPSRPTHRDELEGVLLPAEQTALIAAVPERERPLVVFALVTGLRWSELSWLRWEDVVGTTVMVRRSRGGQPTKSGKPRRVPLLPPAMAALQTLRRERGAKGYVFGHPRAYRPSGWTRWVRAAGIERRVRFHDLRHTTATSLLAGWWGGRRWKLDEVCKMLGHASITTTERYAKKLDSTLEDVASQTFPGGSVFGASAGDDSAGDGFLNRWPQIRILPGAQGLSSVGGEPSGNLPSRLQRALKPGVAPGVVALAEAYRAVVQGDELATGEALARAARRVMGR